MGALPILQVDAFTDMPFRGNPAAVVLDAEELTERQMQAVAREMNLSETVFVTSSAVADFRLRFFTPRKEIPLAGHPTIAAVHGLVEEERIRLAGERTTVTLQLNIGVLPAEIVRDPGGRLLIIMTQRPPEFLTTYPRDEVAAVLGVKPADVCDPVQTVSTGTPQLMVRMHDPALLASVRPDFEALAGLTEQGDFFSVHVFALDPRSPRPRAFARHFAPAAGVDEDPVTGSASGAMGAYVVHYGLISTQTLVAEQGHMVDRPGRVYIDVVSRAGTIEAVKVAGEAVTVLRGHLLVDGR